MDDFMKEQEALDAAGSLKQNTQAFKQQKGAPIVDINAVAAEDRAIKDFGTTNWIGMLMEYRQYHKVGLALAGEGLTFHEATIGPAPHRFTCTVSIAEAPEPIGGSVSFAIKKNAKRFAAKLAIQWLIENKFMPGDGTISFPKPVPPQQVKKVKTSPQLTTPQSTSQDASRTTTPSQMGQTYAAEVPTLCHKLGIGIPSYIITQKNPILPIYDVYADFDSDPRIEGKIGEVENVYGKKNAKEESAKLTVLFLQEIEKKKNKMYEEEDRKRNRDAASLPLEEDRKRNRDAVSPPLEEDGRKTIKVED